MFELVDLYGESTKAEKLDVANEEELYGLADANKSIKFQRLLDWINKASESSKAKFLKCLICKKVGGAASVTIANITGIEAANGCLHPHSGITFDNAVTIAFQEGDTAPAMTIEDAVQLMNGIAEACTAKGIDLNNVEVFTKDVKGKLTQFCWYYDTDSDTACIVKNMNPKAVKRFFESGSPVVAKAAETPMITDKLIDQLAKVEDQINALNAKRDAIYQKMEDLPPTA